MLMTSSSNTGSPDPERVDTEILLLDKPCEYCKLLHLDEAKHSDAVRHKHKGEGYRFFGNVRRTLQTTLQTVRLNLGYKREDVLPNLPGLAASVSQGCAFCEILRGDIISILPKLGNVVEEVDGSSGPQTKLIITEVCYELEKYYGGEVRQIQMTTLTSLYVYFRVEVGGGPASNHSLHYNFYAETSGIFILTPWCFNT